MLGVEMLLPFCNSIIKSLQNLCRNLTVLLCHRRLSTQSWLEAKFAEMGLEVYSQNFTANIPVSFTAQVSQPHLHHMHTCLHTLKHLHGCT